jgi:hypothetical protein
MHVHEHDHLHAAGSLPAALGDAGLHAVGLTLFIFLMMVLVDYLNTCSRGRLTAFMRGGKLRQYVSAALLGAVPGCLGPFMAVTLYLRGMLGLGGLVAAMVATTGDAIFIMLAEFPLTALWLSLGLVAGGVVAGALADLLLGMFRVSSLAVCCAEHQHVEDVHACRIWPEVGLGAQWLRPHRVRLLLAGLVVLTAAGVLTGLLGEGGWGWSRALELGLVGVGAFVVVTAPDEYLVHHMIHHVVKKHLPRVAAWTLGTLVLLAVAGHFVDLRELLGERIGWVILGAGLVGLLPDASPQLVFVLLYAQGAVPLSVLVTSALVQDGHGMLPLLSAGLRAPLLVKGLKLVLGLGLGYGLWAFGL